MPAIRATYAGSSKYIALDGFVCCGKTTLAKRIGSLTGWEYVPEYMDILNAQRRAPSTILEPHERVSLFLSLEEKRLESISVASTNIIADRSILSILSFECAMHSIGERSALYDSDLLHKVQVTLPLLTFSFSSDYSAIRERWAKRGYDARSVFVSTPFLEATTEYFNRTADKLSIHPINISGMTLESTQRRILNAIDEHDVGPTPTKGQRVALGSLL